MREISHLTAAAATRRMLGAAVAVALVAAPLAGCGSDSTGPSGEKPTGDLHFLRPAPDAPPLANPQLTFTATRGVRTEQVIYYRPRAGESDSSEFLRFRVDDGSLDRRPDGTPIANGESVLITITVVDAARLIVDFQPSGLRFAADRPARLHIHFAEADHDFNDDGVVNGTDAELERELSIWRQERDGDPWTKEPSLVETELDEVEADILGFTHYAVAY